MHRGEPTRHLRARTFGSAVRPPPCVAETDAPRGQEHTSLEDASDNEEASSPVVLDACAEAACDAPAPADLAESAPRGVTRRHAPEAGDDVAARDAHARVEAGDDGAARDAHARVDALHGQPSWMIAPIHEQHLSAFWTANRASASARLRVMRAVGAKGAGGAACGTTLLATVVHDVSRSPARYQAFIRALRAQRG